MATISINIKGIDYTANTRIVEGFEIPEKDIKHGKSNYSIYSVNGEYFHDAITCEYTTLYNRQGVRKDINGLLYKKATPANIPTDNPIIDIVDLSTIDEKALFNLVLLVECSQDRAGAKTAGCAHLLEVTEVEKDGKTEKVVKIVCLYVSLSTILDILTNYSGISKSWQHYDQSIKAARGLKTRIGNKSGKQIETRTMSVRIKPEMAQVETAQVETAQAKGKR